ncbi:MAG: MarR family winged helix-turn-helix transcriptional regulator [Desertimonas sp.]
MALSHDAVVVTDADWRRAGWDAGAHLRAALSIRRVDDLVRAHDDAVMRPHGLTSARHEALALLYFSRTGERTLRDLSDHLVVHPTSVTGTVDALEAAGFVERVPHPSDRRTTLARITEEGRRAMAASCRDLGRRHSGLDALDEAAAERVFARLRPVRVAAGDVPAHGGGADPVLEADAHWAREGWSAGPWFRAAFSIYQAADVIERANLAVLAPLGLTRVRHETLGALYFAPPAGWPMHRLSSVMLVHPTSMTGTIDGLERLGYARRGADPDDRRRTLVRITNAGRDAIEVANHAIAADRCGLGALSTTAAQALFRELTPARRVDQF